MCNTQKFFVIVKSNDFLFQQTQTAAVPKLDVAGTHYDFLPVQ